MCLALVQSFSILWRLTIRQDDAMMEDCVKACTFSHNLSLLSFRKEQQSGLDCFNHIRWQQPFWRCWSCRWGVVWRRSCSGRKEMSILRLREGRKKGARRRLQNWLAVFPSVRLVGGGVRLAGWFRGIDLPSTSTFDLGCGLTIILWSCRSYHLPNWRYSTQWRI